MPIIFYPNIRKHTNVERPYLIAYLSSNCQPHREKMFKLLVEKFGNKTVHALGDCSNNTKNDNDKSWYNAYNIYKDYSFTLTMENTIADGYITEKIMNAYIAGSVPIYYGTDKIREFF